MKTNEEIKILFLKKIKNASIETINVSSLCDELKIKRQTFYYYYRDIYDLVDSILTEYKTDFINSKNGCKNSQIIDFCSDNYVLFNNCCNSSLQELIYNFVFDLYLKAVGEKVREVGESKLLSNSALIEISSFIANGISSLICSELRKNSEFNKDTIINKIEIFSSLPLLENVVNEYIENRRKI